MPSLPLAHDVSLMSTLAVKSALLGVIVPAFERQSDAKVHCEFDPTNVLQERIAHGARADILIATRVCVADLAASGIVDASTTRALVRTGVGIGVAEGATYEPVMNEDDLCKLLLEAKSVAYSRTGASGVYFLDLIERLGIAGRVNARATVIEKGFAGECIVRGEADIAIQQISELAMVDGISVLGPLPEAVQSYTDFDVAMFNGRPSSKFGVGLFESLFSEVACGAYRRLGLATL